MSIQLSEKALKRQDDNKPRWAGSADDSNTQQWVNEMDQTGIPKINTDFNSLCLFHTLHTSVYGGVLIVTKPNNKYIFVYNTDPIWSDDHVWSQWRKFQIQYSTLGEYYRWGWDVREGMEESDGNQSGAEIPHLFYTDSKKFPIKDPSKCVNAHSKQQKRSYYTLSLYFKVNFKALYPKHLLSKTSVFTDRHNYQLQI